MGSQDERIEGVFLNENISWLEKLQYFYFRLSDDT